MPRTKSTPAPLPEEIARRAFALYQSRGCTNGSDVDDWLEAERQLALETAPRAARISSPASPRATRNSRT